MITWFKTRLIVEKPSTHDKYYPSVISATIQKSSPFSISHADIELASNIIGSTSSYISQFRFDDIVRLQVSVKYNPNQWTVWRDIFHGRIMDIDCDYSTNNNVKIYAEGHESEARTALIEETKAYTSTTDARTVLSYFAPLYLSRLEYSSSYADTGVSFPTYDSTANQTFMSDLFSDMEKTSGYDWAIKTVPVYTSSGNLDTVYIQWAPFDTEATDKYKIIEGTSRVITASFSVTGSTVRTAYRMNGDTPSGSSQYTGYASDSALITTYGKRTGVDTQTWIESDSLCASIASGVLADKKTPEISGQVKLMFTPEADLGDLVTCKFRSVDLNGSYISTDLYVKRVQHTINDDGCFTVLDLGQIRKTSDDFIGTVSKTVSTCKKNQVT